MTVSTLRLSKNCSYQIEKNYYKQNLSNHNNNKQYLLKILNC
jgi:hypothetical protein